VTWERTFTFPAPPGSRCIPCFVPILASPRFCPLQLEKTFFAYPAESCVKTVIVDEAANSAKVIVLVPHFFGNREVLSPKTLIANRIVPLGRIG